MKLLTRASARYLRQHRAQLVLSVVGVALGVAVVLAIDLATGSARTAFRVSAEAVAGRATHEVTSDLGTIDETLLTRIRVDLGFHAAAPVVEGHAISPAMPGRALRLLGVDPLSELPFRSYVLGGRRGGGSRQGDSETGDARAGDSGHGETQPGDARAGDSRHDETQTGDARAGDSRRGETQTADARAGDSRRGETQTGDARAGDSRRGETQTGDARPGDSQTGDAGPARMITTPWGVLLPATAASEAGLEPGDSLPAVVDGRVRALPVVGVLDPADRVARAGLADVLVMDIAGAQELLGMRGRLTRIDLRVPEGPAGDTVLASVRELLGPGESLAPAGARAATMADMTRAFEVNLTALSLLALIFGAFLIYNAVTFSVVQRRALFGRLRALGVTRAEVLRSVVGEAVWIGLAGSALGLAAGMLLARGLVGLVARTINDLYFSVSVESVALEPVLVVKAMAIGLGATLLAALPPALEAASTEPRLAMVRSSAEARARRLVPRAAWAGAALLAIGGLALGPEGTGLTVSFGALFLVVLGLALLTPLGTVLLVRASQPVLVHVQGTLGRVAARGVVASLTRTAPAVAALVVAVSVTVGLGVMIQSFRATLESWLARTLRADVYVSVPGPGASRASGTLDTAVVRALLAHPAVAGRTSYRAADVVVPEGPFHLLVVDLDPRHERAFAFLDGDAEAIMTRFTAGGGAIVSEPFAFRRGLGPGDSVALPTAAGRVRAPVLGVFYDYGSDRGTVMVSRVLGAGWFDDERVTSLALYLAPGADPGAVARELTDAVPEGLAVSVRPSAVLRAASLEVFDRTFEVTAVLRMLAFVVAFVGVLAALMALELERAREVGVLRAWGLEPREVWKLVMTQTGLVGLLAGVLAAPAGLVLAVVMIFVVNKRSFGWTLEMHVGPEILGQAVGLALVAALLAGLYPAWRMSRTPPAIALRGE